MGRAARCGLADGADGEGRSDGDGEGVISGVGIAAGKRSGAVRKKIGFGRNHQLVRLAGSSQRWLGLVWLAGGTGEGLPAAPATSSAESAHPNRAHHASTFFSVHPCFVEHPALPCGPLMYVL